METTADALFGTGGIFERGAWEECRALFAPRAAITQHFGAAPGGDSVKPISVDQFIASMGGPAGAALGLPIYGNRRVSATASGFVEPETSADGRSRPMDVCWC